MRRKKERWWGRCKLVFPLYPPAFQFLPVEPGPWHLQKPLLRGWTGWSWRSFPTSNVLWAHLKIKKCTRSRMCEHTPMHLPLTFPSSFLRAEVVMWWYLLKFLAFQPGRTGRHLTPLLFYFKIRITVISGGPQLLLCAFRTTVGLPEPRRLDLSTYRSILNHWKICFLVFKEFFSSFFSHFFVYFSGK